MAGRQDSLLGRRAITEALNSVVADDAMPGSVELKLLGAMGWGPTLPFIRIIRGGDTFDIVTTSVSPIAIPRLMTPCGHVPEPVLHPVSNEPAAVSGLNIVDQQDSSRTGLSGAAGP